MSTVAIIIIIVIIMIIPAIWSWPAPRATGWQRWWWKRREPNWRRINRRRKPDRVVVANDLYATSNIRDRMSWVFKDKYAGVPVAAHIDASSKAHDGCSSAGSRTESLRMIGQCWYLVVPK